MKNLNHFSKAPSIVVAMLLGTAPQVGAQCTTLQIQNDHPTDGALVCVRY